MKRKMEKENANTKINDNRAKKASTPTGNLKNTSVGADFTSAQNGITLIALVITIIILLILAGVAINMLLGENGILKTAKFAAEKYENAATQEENMLAQVGQYMNNTRNNIDIVNLFKGEALKGSENSLKDDFTNYKFLLVYAQYHSGYTHCESILIQTSDIAISDTALSDGTKYSTFMIEINSNPIVFYFNSTKGFVITDNSTPLLYITDIYGIN